MKTKSLLLGLLCATIIGVGFVPAAYAKTKSAAAAPAAASTAPQGDPANAAATPEAAATAAAAASETKAPATAEPHYAERGAETCMKCHDQDYQTRNGNQLLDILKTPHAVKGDGRTPFGSNNQDCETCHGASSDHVHSKPAPGEKRASPAIVFVGPNASPIEKRNEVCIGCHENGLRMNWQGSQHQDNNIACTSCHTVHAKKDPVLVKDTQPEKCFTCHAEQRALSFQFSHHPIREGKVVCSDCHNPHGSPGPTLLKEVRVTDLCYNCHTEKRGPLLWEHQPVREDCTNCHNPHGSVNPRLLKEKVPFLCLDCHAATNDMGGVGVSVHSAASGSGSLYLYGDRSCLNCHSQIHGSNSPSGSTFFR